MYLDLKTSLVAVLVPVTALIVIVVTGYWAHIDFTIIPFWNCIIWSIKWDTAA
jgi:hypothetical protein